MALELVCLYFGAIQPEEDAEEDVPFASTLTLEERRLRSKKIPRIALRRHAVSDFMLLLRSGCAQALLNICGMGHRSFRGVLALFTPFYNRYKFDDNNNVHMLPSSTTTASHGCWETCKPTNSYSACVIS